MHFLSECSPWLTAEITMVQRGVPFILPQMTSSHFKGTSSIKSVKSSPLSHERDLFHLLVGDKLNISRMLLLVLECLNGLVYWGLTPQQQPGSYQVGENDDELSYLVEETGVPGGNHRPTACN